MVKVKTLKRFNDMAEKKVVKNVIRKKDDEFEVSEERAKQLVKQGMVKVVEQAKGKKTEETK